MTHLVVQKYISLQNAIILYKYTYWTCSYCFLICFYHVIHNLNIALIYNNNHCNYEITGLAHVTCY